MKIHILLLFIILVVSCDKQNNTDDNIHQGKIVGYLKCIDSEIENNTLFGLFIISNNNDSLLAFNIPYSVHNIDSSQLEFGIDFINGDSISFTYRIAREDEIKYYDCPPTFYFNPSFYAIDNFSQVIITNINNI